MIMVIMSVQHITIVFFIIFSEITKFMLVKDVVCLKWMEMYCEFILGMTRNILSAKNINESKNPMGYLFLLLLLLLNP